MELSVAPSPDELVIELLHFRFTLVSIDEFSSHDLFISTKTQFLSMPTVSFIPF